jgi:hypothetical protein
MDKLKAVKSNLTGDWATVSCHFEPVRRGETLHVTADVTVKDQAISTEGVVIEVRCEELIDIPNATVWDNSSSSSSSSATGRATSSESVFDTEVTAAGPQELAGGSTVSVSADIPIPATEPPTMQGRYARYEWQVRARVDMKGNDPDSGWQTLQVG